MNETLKDLMLNAGLDSLRDRLAVGRIQGLTWLAEWQPDFHEEEEGDTQDES